MVNIVYQRLFNLKITHTYYKNGLAKGVELIPVRDTVDLIRNGKMLLKYLPHEMVVLYRGLNETPPVDPPNPFINLGKDFKLTFTLKVENKSEFVNTSEMDTSTASYSSGKILYFKNNPSSPVGPEIISHTLIDSLRSSLFTYTFTLPDNTEEVDFVLFKVNDDNTETKVSSGKDALGQDLPLNFELDQKENNSYSHSVDLRAQSFGRYRILVLTQGGDENDSNDHILEEHIYVHDELAGQDVLGVVDIVYDTANDKAYGATENYDIHFESKKTLWKYVIVNKNGRVNFGAGQTLEIPSVTPASPYVNTSFILSGAQPNADVKINGSDTVVFLSDKTIPFFEEPMPDIRLVRDGGTAVDDSDKETLLQHLPNPSTNTNVKKEAAQAASEIYVFL